MTDEELDRLTAVTVADASRYLNREWTANDIRQYAAMGKCPFVVCVRKTGSRRCSYHINVGRLKAYRRGELPLMGT